MNYTSLNFCIKEKNAITLPLRPRGGIMDGHLCYLNPVSESGLPWLYDGLKRTFLIYCSFSENFA